MQQTPATPNAGGVGKILVAGADAESFLQGQLTQDVRKLESGLRLFAGYCSAKGRLLATMWLERGSDGIALELHRSVLDATLKRLRMFVLRSKVTMTALPLHVQEDRDASWRRELILAGVPTIFPQTSDHFVPQMCNLDRLGAISYDKGCYTGQEIVARLHYLGQLKRRMYGLQIADAAGPSTPVYDVASPEQPVGEIVDAQGGHALAVLQISHAQGSLRIGAADGPTATVTTDFASAAA